MSRDPFGTGALRDGVHNAWRGSPTRFREDANAEADLVHGGYADRLFVELAQNAADAAQRSGVAGRLRLSLVDGQLRAANTGAPLDAAGVTALASLRASAKRVDDDTADTADTAAVGRFGVGFSAVLAVTDAPRLVSTTGGVQFSAQRTVDAVTGDASLDSELARRGGRPPVLRLLWPVDDDEPDPPEGFDTEVRLPLRAEVDGADLLARCAAQAADLLLALPWLERIEAADRSLVRDGDDPVVVHGDGEVWRWRVVRRSGRLDRATVEGLGPEARPEWSLCWALPVSETGGPLPLGPDVLHAPTATAEPLTLPARLIAGVPLEPSRRHLLAGPAADAVLAAAAAAYPQLATAVAATDRIGLVPEPGFPAGEVDAALRDQVLAALREAEWLPAADGRDVSPDGARVLDVPVPGLVELLADVDGGLLAADLAEPRHAPALAALGVSRIGPAALVELLAGLDRPPEWWHRCYVALAGLLDADPAARDELGALPVPLTDGRTVTGPRGVLLGGVLLGEVPLHDVAGLRLVHPDAAHPLLERLGARPVGPAELLDALRPAVERSVEDAEDGADTEPLATAVLGLAAQLGDPPSRRPWLGALALHDADGQPCRADELVTPDAALRSVLVPDAPLGVLADGYAADAARAVGVLDSFAVLDEPDPAGPDHELDDEEGWWDAIGGDAAPPPRLLAVRDLDLVDEACWPAALRLLAAEPVTAAAVREPGGYTGWWLARHALLDGTPLRRWRLPSAEPDLGGLHDPVPVEGLDEGFLAAAGVRSGLRVDGPQDAVDLLARLADPVRPVTPAVVHAAHAALTAADLDPADVDPPSQLRARTGAVVPAEQAVVLDSPWLAAVLPADGLVSGGDPEVLAELLDLPLASEEAAGAELLADRGRSVQWAELVEVVSGCAAAGLTVPSGSVVLHERLQVRHGGVTHDVAYWVDHDGTVHATDPLRALLRP